MDELGLEITKTYHAMYTFYSKRDKCLGVIKYLVVTLSQLTMKSVVMDIVVVDIPSNFGISLSRSWTKKVEGSMQMDMSFVTILVFGGVYKRLYRENQLDYIVNDHDNPDNHPIYVVEDGIGSCILCISDDDPKQADYDSRIFVKDKKGMENEV